MRAMCMLPTGKLFLSPSSSRKTFFSAPLPGNPKFYYPIAINPHCVQMQIEKSIKQICYLFFQVYVVGTLGYREQGLWTTLNPYNCVCVCTKNWKYYLASIFLYSAFCTWFWSWIRLKISQCSEGTIFLRLVFCLFFWTNLFDLPSAEIVWVLDTWWGAVEHVCLLLIDALKLKKALNCPLSLCWASWLSHVVFVALRIS